MVRSPEAPKITIAHGPLCWPLPRAGASREVNEVVFIVVMIETPEAVANAEAIAAVPGIDALLLGCGDLSTEMGIPGQLEDSKMVKAIETVIAGCKAKGNCGAKGACGAKDGAKKDGAKKDDPKPAPPPEGDKK